MRQKQFDAFIKFLVRAFQSFVRAQAAILMIVLCP